MFVNKNLLSQFLLVIYSENHLTDQACHQVFIFSSYACLKKICCTWIVLYTDRSELTSRIVRDSATKLLFIGANFVQVLVEFGEKRHVMWISEKGSLDVQMLLKEVKNAFSIQSRECSYCIQKFDQDWNEWVDVTDASALVNRDKLELIKANREVTEVSLCLSEN